MAKGHNAAAQLVASQNITDLLKQDDKKKHMQNVIIKNPIEISDGTRWMNVEASSLVSVPYPVYQDITPSFAASVLAHRNVNNRKMRNSRVKKWTQDMLDDKWEDINNGIGFYKDGTVADGQHRLQAVVESQQTVKMLVVYGMDPTAMVAIDENAVRTANDIAKMKGIDTSSRAQACSGFILENLSKKRTMSRRAQLEFYERHTGPIQFVISRLTAKHVNKAPVCAALVRAYYNVDHKELEGFIHILQTGENYDRDKQSATYLRNWLVQNNENNTGPARTKAYRKTESALQHFLDRKYIARLYGTKEELYPLPEEKCGKGV